MLRDTSSKKLVEAMQPHDMADFVLNGCGGMQAYRHSQRSSKICRRLFIAPKQARQAQKAGREAPVPGPSSDAQSHPGSVLLESSLSGGLGTARGAARERAPPGSGRLGSQTLRLLPNRTRFGKRCSCILGAVETLCLSQQRCSCVFEVFATLEPVQENVLD